MKIIPAIDLMGGQVVRLLRGRPQDKTVYGSDPAGVAAKWEKEGADMLHVVDLDATLGSGTNTALVREIAKSVSIPVEVAGGLRTRKAVEDAMEYAGRAVLGTLAFADRAELERLIGVYGSDRIVVALDHSGGRVVVDGWRKSTEADAMGAMRDFMGMGLTEFLLTDVGRDGTMGGPDLEGLKDACKLDGANVIASGGISGIEDVRCVRQTGAYGVILGKALYEGRISISEARMYGAD